jgi:hypothetical protein
MTNSATPHRIDVWHEKKKRTFETYSIINRPSSHEARDRGPSLEASSCVHRTIISPQFPTAQKPVRGRRPRHDTSERTETEPRGKRPETESRSKRSGAEPRSERTETEARRRPSREEGDGAPHSLAPNSERTTRSLEMTDQEPTLQNCSFSRARKRRLSLQRTASQSPRSRLQPSRNRLRTTESPIAPQTAARE